ncbi:MAG TPA: filamentous hemagglutinin N-terminal domain-containing protein [Stellaceae bacterium]|nr:filamentous hemagglutinin N-terminal domain-containing protein [Stellaceae bacterium]
MSTIITQSTPKAILNWQSFSIPGGTSVQFVQPSAGSVALNRVIGPSASNIQGQLTANGQVWLVNANGVFFGPGARVDVAGLIATTADIKNADFLAGNYNFGTPSPNPNASVVNQGAIRIESGGVAALMGARVDNQGLVEAQFGSVVLAGGKTFTVSLAGNSLVSFAVASPVDQTPAEANGTPAKALVTNEGTLNATGGTVMLTARAVKNVVDNVINTTGIVEAQSARLVNGEIVIDGGGGGVAVSGTVDASGKSAGQTGGTVSVLGGTVSLTSGANIDVSGDQGGGTALVGGNVHGAGPQQNALTTTISAGVMITANAITAGSGGQVAIWSEQQTTVAGTITATGGASGGNGGFVETSSRGLLTIAPSAIINVGATDGLAGTWLLDPPSVTIGNDSGDVSASSITDALGNGNVLIETQNDGGSGDIVVNVPLMYSSTHDLSLLAVGSIHANASILNSAQGAGGAIYLVAGWDGKTGVTAGSQSVNIQTLETTPGSYGGTANGGDVFINYATSRTAVSVGSAFGPTVVLGHNVTVQGGGTGVAGYSPGDRAQIGFAPFKAGQNTGGDITVIGTGNIALIGGEQAGSPAQIGHGAPGTFYSATNVTLAGNITVSAAGSVLLMGGFNFPNSFAQIGHGGSPGAFNGTYSSGNSVTLSGNINVTAGAGMSLIGGDRSSDLSDEEGGGDNYAQIGHGGAQLGQNGSFVNFVESGNITVDVTGTLLLSGNLGHADNIGEETPGPGEPEGDEGRDYAQIGHGGAQFLASAHVSGIGENIGNITVTATQAIDLEGAPNDFLSYAQIGHGGLQAFSGTNNGAGRADLVESGNITIVVGTPSTAGQLILQGGGGALSYAMIGHGGLFDPGSGTNAEITESGNITITVGGADSAGQSLLSLQGGSGSTPANPLPNLDSFWNTGGAFAQIGHGGLSGGPGSGSLSISGDIDVTVGAPGAGNGTVILAGGGTNADNYAQIGHGGIGTLQSAAITGPTSLSGNIVILASGPVSLTGGTGDSNYAQIGDVVDAPESGKGAIAGNIDLRAGGAISVAGAVLIGQTNDAGGGTTGSVIIEASSFSDGGSPGIGAVLADSIANDLLYGDVSILDTSTFAPLALTGLNALTNGQQPLATALNIVSEGSVTVARSIDSPSALTIVAGWDGTTGLPAEPGSGDFNVGAVASTASASGNHQGAISVSANIVTANVSVSLIGPVVVTSGQSVTIGAGSGAVTVTGTVTGGGSLALPGSGLVQFDAAVDLGTLNLSGKTGGSLTVDGPIDLGLLATGSGNYTIAFLDGGTIASNTTFANQGGTTLSGVFTFPEGMTVNALTLAGATTLIGDTSTIVLGTVDQGSNTFTVIADAVNLEGAWTGGGARVVEPYSPLSIGLAGAPGQFQLSAAELAILAGGGSGPVTIGTTSALNGGGNGPVTADSFTFGAPLTLIGSSITITGDIVVPTSWTFAAGSGAVTVTGTVTGGGSLALPGSGLVQFDAAVDLGTLNLTGKTGGLVTIIGPIDLGALATGSGNYPIVLLGGGTIASNTTFANQGGVALSGDFQFPDGLTIDGVLNLAGDTSINTGSDALTVMGPVSGGGSSLALLGSGADQFNAAVDVGVLDLSGKTGGSVTVDGPIDLGALATGSGSYAIAFLDGGTISAATTFANQGGTSFAGGFQFPGGLTIDGALTLAGDTSINTGSNPLTVMGPVSGGGSSLALPGSGLVQFDAAVDLGVLDLTGKTGGSVTIDGPIDLGALATGSGNYLIVLLGGGTIDSNTTFANQGGVALSGGFQFPDGLTIDGALNLAGDTSINTGSDALTVMGPVNGSSSSLALPGSGVVQFDGAVDLGMLDLSGKTGGSVTVDGPIDLGALATGSGNYPIVLLGGGMITSNTTFANQGGVALSGSFQFPGGLTIDGLLTLAGDTSINTGSDPLTVMGPVSGGGSSLALPGSGLVQFDAAVDLGVLDLSGKTGGSVTIIGPIDLGALATGSGNYAIAFLDGGTISAATTFANQGGTSFAGNFQFPGGLTIDGALTLAGDTSINTGSDPLTVTGPVSGGGSLALPGSGLVQFDAAVDLGVLDLTGKTGGLVTIIGPIDLGALATGSGNYPIVLLGGGTIDSNTTFANQGGTALSGTFTFPGGMTVNALVLAGDTTLIGDTSTIVLGTVNQGNNTFTVIADAVSLDGAWTGGGARVVEPYSPLSIGLAGAAGQFQLSTAELAILAGGGGGPVTIGTTSALNGGGNGPISTGNFTFDAPLTLIGSSITINGTLVKSDGSLISAAVTGEPAIGPISGSVSLGSGTGVLEVVGSSVVLTDSTVNGQTGAAGAQQIVVLPPFGPGPYTFDGIVFFVPPTSLNLPLGILNPQTYIGNGEAFLNPNAPDSFSSQSGSGSIASQGGDAASFLSANTGPVNHDRPLITYNLIAIMPHLYEQQNLGMEGGSGSDDSVLSDPPSQ